MAGASGIRAGKAYVELFADDRRLVAGLRSAQRKLAAFGAAVRQTGMQLAGIGLGVVAPLALAAKSFADTGSELNDMSARTGASVESLSELGYAAGQTGASMADVEKSMRVMQKTVAAAARGSDSAAAALGRVGLSAEALAGATPDQQFLAISEALQTIEDPGQRAAAALGVFGKSGAILLPMISEFSTLRDEARRLGVVMSTTQAKAADDLGDAFSRVTAILRSVVNAIGGALAPTLTALANEVGAFLVGLRDWISGNQHLVVTVLGVGAAIIAAGIGLVVLGSAVGAVSAGVGALAAIASATGTVLSALGGIIGALLTPIGAVILGTAAFGGVLLTQTESGQQALGMLGDGFQTLAADASDAWTGIADALAAGNITLAAQVVWAGLKLEWERGTSFLLNVWDAAVGGFAKLFATSWFGIQEVFWTVVNGIADAWDWVVGGITTLWNDAIGGIASRLASLLELVGLADEGLSLEIQRETVVRNQDADTGRSERSAERDRSVEELTQQRHAIVAGIDDQMVEQMLGRDAGIERARAELTAALTEARQQKQAVRDRVAGPRPAGAGARPDMEALQAALDRLPDTIAAEASKLDVVGSFNAGAVGQLGVGDSTTERTAKASEETARNTKRLLGLLDDPGLEFG